MRARLLLLSPAILFVTSAAVTAAPAARVIATAPLIGSDGSAKGNAEIVSQGSKVMLNVMASGMPAGEHGIHLHAVGKCDAPGFTTAGAHLNPTMKMHGTQNPKGPHLGDLPNVIVAADGTATYSAPIKGMKANVVKQMMDADGTALVVHATADDYKTDPSGNSGGRIACGVVTKAA